jgi:hypothetical protein
MGDRLMITVDDAAAAAAPLQKTLEEAGLTDISMERAAPNLEDLFVQVVRRDEKTGGEKAKRAKGEKGQD